MIGPRPLVAKAVPPKFVSVPWYPLTVVLEAVSSTTPFRSSFTAANLSAAILAQLGLALLPNQRLMLRLQHMGYWMQTNASTTSGFGSVTANGYIQAANPSAQSGTVNSNYQEVNCQESRMGVTHCGFRWPKAVQDLSIQGDQATRLFSVGGTFYQANAVILVQVHVLWATDSIAISRELMPGPTLTPLKARDTTPVIVEEETDQLRSEESVDRSVLLELSSPTSRVRVPWTDLDVDSGDP